MIIKGVSAKEILDSRKEKTILVSIKTNAGDFSASAPNGKSKGKYEAKPYKKNFEEDIKTIEKKLIKEVADDLGETPLALDEKTGDALNV